MIRLAKTLRGHATGILNYFKHRISTAKLEGINHKIKNLKRRAYGYRDETFSCPQALQPARVQRQTVRVLVGPHFPDEPIFFSRLGARSM